MVDLDKTVPVIAIDGPGGSGKGTLCSLLAQQLGWHLLDSGALYRVLGYGVETNGLWDADQATWVELAQNLPITFPIINGSAQAYYDGESIESEIRNEEAARRASIVASNTDVRKALLSRQRSFAQAPGLIADGRDMGTVVFPDAPLKVFLTASSEERAKRRYLQLKEAGQDVSLAALLKDIEERDARDRNRAASPLVAAADAIELDSTHLSIEDVLSVIMDAVKTRQLCEY